MPVAKKSGKKAANVDRYGQRDRGEADAEDASVLSVGEEEDSIEEPEPLLDGGESHEAPPKEWTLPDGSPVWRAGKKSLRLEPRLNRNGHGEDSSDIDGGRRTRREGEVEDEDYNDYNPEPIYRGEPVPVNTVIPSIAAATPRGVSHRRNSPRQVRDPNGSPRQVRAPAALKQAVINQQIAAENARTLSPLILLLIALAALIGAAIMLLLFSTYHPAIILTTNDLRNGTVINPLIDRSPGVVDAHRKLDALREETNKEIVSVRTKLQDIDGKLVQLSLDMRKELAKANADLKSDLAAGFTARHDALVSKLEKERMELNKDLEALKKSMNEQLAKKLDVSDFEKRFKLDELQNKINLATNALLARVEILEKRPTIVTPITTGDPSPTPTTIPHAEIAALRAQLNDLQGKQTTLAETVAELQKAEKKLNELISTQLSSPAAQTQIIKIINNYLATGSNTDLAKAINHLANEAMTHNKEFTTVLHDLAGVTTRSNALEASIAAVTKDVAQAKESQTTLGKDVTKLGKEIHDLRNRAPGPQGPAPTVDLSGVFDRLKKLEDSATGTSGSQSMTPEIKNELASLRVLAEAARNEAATAKNEVVSADSRRISDKEAIQARLAEIEQRLASTSSNPSNPTTTAPVSSTSGVTPEVVKSLIAEELKKRVDHAAATVGMPDHALYTAGGRVILGATGFDPKLSWSAVSGTGSSGGFFPSFMSLFGSHSANAPGSRNVPSIALDPSLTPGFCWPFPGQRANFSVSTACPVTPTAFTIDHIPASEAISPNSMPHKFNVWGWRLNDTALAHPVPRVKLVADAEYKQTGATAQTFHIDKLTLAEFDAFTLEIASNYGDVYTCLYRFRIHGTRDARCSANPTVSNGGLSA